MNTTLQTITPVNPDAKLEPVVYTGPKALEGRPPEGVYVAYEEASGASAGVWTSEAGVINIKNRTRGEFCYLLEGQVEITDETGQTFKFSAGSAFVIPKGFTGKWSMPIAVKKYFAEF